MRHGWLPVPRAYLPILHTQVPLACQSRHHRPVRGQLGKGLPGETSYTTSLLFSFYKNLGCGICRAYALVTATQPRQGLFFLSPQKMRPALLRILRLRDAKQVLKVVNATEH
jgi:hypothetical protein